MTRVAVIGNAGGGKSTLCQHLSKTYNLPHHYIDLIQWQPNWKPTPTKEVSQQVNDIFREERWIIDGWGSWDSIEKRFSLADTVIMVDFPLHYHYWWSTKRQVKSIFRPRADLPPNCPMWKKSRQLYQTIAYIHENMRPRIHELLALYQNDGAKQVHVLRSPTEMKRFKNKHIQH